MEITAGSTNNALKLEDHLRVCTKQKTECPFVQIGCDNEGASKDVIVTHLQNETFAHSQLLIELIHNLKNEVDGLKDKSEISQSEISTLREELTLKDVQIEEIKLQMEEQKREMEEQKRDLDCLKEESRDRKSATETLEEDWAKLRNEAEIRMREMTVQMEEQNREMKIVKESNKRESLEKKFEELRNEVEIRNREITVQMEEQKREMEIVKVESNKRDSAMRTLNEEMGKLRNEAEIRKREMTVQMEEQKCAMERVKEESNKRESAMRTLNEEMGKLRNEAEIRKREMTVQMEELKKLRNAAEARSTSIIRCDKFPFEWRINECKTKMATMRRERIISESFFSYGYKLCLSIYIGFNKDDIYLYCHIMQGDNDDQLHWPMRLKVRLSLVNQGTLSTHTSRTTKLETDKHNNRRVFNRPTTFMNEDGIQVTGSPFIKYSCIKDDRSVMVNDSIIITCILSDTN